MHIREIILEIDKKNYDTIPSVQFDSKTRFLHIRLLSGGIALDVSKMSVKISANKPDGTEVFNDCKKIDAENGFIEVELTEQFNAATGEVNAAIKLYGVEGVLSTKPFTIKVTKDTATKAVTSSNEFKGLTSALNEVNKYNEEFSDKSGKLEELYTERLNQVEDGKADKSYVEENIEEINSNLETLANEEVVINRLGYKSGDDIYDVVTEQFANPNVGKVTVLNGTYTIKDRIVIPPNKTLELQGEDNNVYIQTIGEVDDNIYTIIKPTFTDKSVIELKSRSCIIKGFIDCTKLTSGNAIFINPSQTDTWSPTVKHTKGLGNGSLNTAFLGIMCDRPVGTRAGFLVYGHFEFGCFMFGKGLWFVRNNTYDTVEGANGGINDCCWSTSHKVKGYIGACERAVYIQTSTRPWAFGSTEWDITIQGSPWFNNENIPAFECKSDDNKFNIQWHDISPTQHQKIRMKLDYAVNNIIYNSARTDKDIIDNTQKNTYLKDSVCENGFSNILDGVTLTDGFTVVNGNVCLINFMTTLPKATTWTKLCNLPFISGKQIRMNVKSNLGTNIVIMISSNNNELLYLMPSNAQESETITVNCYYPLLNTV